MLKKVLYFSIYFASLTSLSTILCMEKAEKAIDLQDDYLNVTKPYDPFEIPTPKIVMNQNTLCFQLLDEMNTNFKDREEKFKKLIEQKTINFHRAVAIKENIIQNPLSLIEIFEKNTNDILSVNKYTEDSPLERIMNDKMNNSDHEDPFFEAIYKVKLYYSNNQDENSIAFFTLVNNTLAIEKQNLFQFKQGVNFIRNLRYISTEKTISAQNLPECLNYINLENCNKYFFYIRNCPLFEHLKNILSNLGNLTSMFIHNRSEILDLDEKTNTYRLERIINFKMLPNDIDNPAAKAIMWAYLIFEKTNTPCLEAFKKSIKQQISFEKKEWFLRKQS